MARLRNSALHHAAWFLPFLFLAYPIVASMARKWTRSIWDNGHGLIVPFLVALLATRILQRHPVKSEPASPAGFLFLVPALALIAVSGTVKNDYLASLGLLLCLPGLCLLLLGLERTKALAFPFCLAFLMLPLPRQLLGPVHLELRELTTHGSAWALQLIRQPALGEGTLLFLPHGTFHVVDDCSGFSALYASITVAVVLAYLSESALLRTTLLLVAVPLALGSNVVRIVLLALLAEWYGYQILETPVHVLSGYLSFVLALGALFLLSSWMSRSTRH